MKYPFRQGWLDSLCGVYSIVNAHRLVNGVHYNECQPLFDEIVKYLHRKKILHKVMIEGINHKNFSSIMENVCQPIFPIMETNKRGFYNLDEWWDFSRCFLEEAPRRTIILSLGGSHDHLTNVEKITDKKLFLFDSDGFAQIRKSSCRLYGYLKKDKYVIYHSQCWYLGK